MADLLLRALRGGVYPSDEESARDGTPEENDRLAIWAHAAPDPRMDGARTVAKFRFVLMFMGSTPFFLIPHQALRGISDRGADGRTASVFYVAASRVPDGDDAAQVFVQG